MRERPGPGAAGILGALALDAVLVIGWRGVAVLATRRTRRRVGTGVQVS